MAIYVFERKNGIPDCGHCPFLCTPEDDVGGMCYDSMCEYEGVSRDRGYLESDADYQKPDWCPLREITDYK